jgi:putative endonuclease
MNQRKACGESGEALVAQRLEAAGYQILARNVRVGRSEIDIIASRARLVVFCEVRTRSSSALMEPAESIDRAKVARIRKAAAGWLHSQKLQFLEIRFDAASVVLDTPEPRITYYEQAF